MSEMTPGLMTTDEHDTVRLAGELWGLLCRVVASGPTRDVDLGELIVHVHAIQHAVMAQAAARAYPDLYRVLGDSVEDGRAGNGRLTDREAGEVNQSIWEDAVADGEQWALGEDDD